MSDTQKAAAPTVANDNQQASTTRVQDSMRAEQRMDALENEEIGSSFEESSNMEPVQASSLRDNPLSIGLAAAFAQEEADASTQNYETPPLLIEIARFVENFDWNDRSNIMERFYQVQRVYTKIEACQQALSDLLPQIHTFNIPAQKQKALTQLQQDMYQLQSFQKQSADFMDENRPSF